MNKKVEIFQYIILLITIILLIGVRFVYPTMHLGILLMYVLFLVIIVIKLFDQKKNHIIMKDKTYNILIILTCILTDIILLRSVFDTNIISVGFIDYLEEPYQLIFLKSNACLLNTCLFIILGYRLTYQLKIPKISIQISFKNKS